jgi:hypothetical protein
MNNPTKQIKEMARKLFVAKQGSGHIKTLHPERDWMIGVFIAVGIVIGITTWNAHVYLSNRDGGTTEIEVDISNPKYQAELIDQALKTFEQRAENFRLLSGAQQVQDAVVPEELQTETSTTTTSTTSTTTATTTQTDSEINTVADETEQEVEGESTDTNPAEDTFLESTPIPELRQ